MSAFAKNLKAFVVGDVASIVARVERANGDVIAEAACGNARPGGPEIATTSLFHIASIGKIFTAVLVLQLVEQGLLSLNMPLADTGVFDPEIIHRLHRKDGTSQGRSVTLRHLLSHTAGIRDAIVDDATQIGGAPPGSLVGRMLGPDGNPGRFWRPWDPHQPDDMDAGVFNFFLNSGISEAALFSPGEGFHYSDTGYVILGLVLEHVTKMPLHRLYRDRIFTPIGMRHSYLAYRDDPADLGPQRAPECEVWMGPVPCFSGRVSLSFDWAGGGIVSTAADLNRFHRALWRGNLFRKRGTLITMTDWRTLKGMEAPRTGVGLGIFRTQYGGRTLIGHSGHWGVRMQMDPNADLFFAGTINQSHGPADWHVRLLDTLDR